MPSLHRVYISMDRAYSYAPRVTRGVRGYAQPPRNWALLCWPLSATTWGVVDDWGADGVIAAISAVHDADAALAWGKPVVNVSSAHPHPCVPSVLADNEAIGRMAAQHLRDCGARAYACLGLRRGATGLRLQGFCRAVEAFGASAYHLTPPRHRTRIDHRFAAHLHGLPTPIGLFLPDDTMADLAMRGCALAGLEVPSDVLLLGAGDDPLDCELVAPGLSSVHIPWERIGYEAARLLELLAGGHPAPATPILIPPTGITARGTTRQGAHDPAVAAALARIHARRRRPPTVAEVLAAAGVSRRVLDHRMRQACGRTVSAEITHAQLQFAQDLLRTTDLALDAVARQAGFSGAPHLCVTFKRHLGLTPAGYRRLAG